MKKSELKHKRLIPALENDLRERISGERKSEMDRYGRTEAYNRVSDFLHGDRQTAFSLINHALAIIDDKIDANGNKKQLNRAKIILKQGFQRREAKITETWENDILKLGQTLSRSHENNFVHATAIFNEILNYWEIEIQNLNRKGKILKSRELDKLNLEIGRSVGLQFLYLLCPDLDKGSRESIATSYGFAIKLADNLTDLNEDLKEGYINISKENLKKHGDLQSYKKAEFGRLKKYYKNSDKIADEIIEKNPSQQKGILIFKNIAHSWLKQVSEICTIEHLRRFDIANYSTPRFLSTEEILELKNFYGINLSDVIELSYEQEAKNTNLIKKKNPLYNPYSHKKTPQADKTVKRMISVYPEIKNVLDLGCDEGSRTIELFDGKKLYGIELIKESVKKARKKGIKVCQGSITNNFYKDQVYLNGREFDLVSIMGEMVNFIGLETAALLANAIKQIKNDGYFLVSCMHSDFDKAQEGNYVVWSFKNPSNIEWVLAEEKIPRTFLIISKQGLVKKINEIAQAQNCQMLLKDEKIIKNYYKDMPLGIYLFQKNK